MVGSMVPLEITHGLLHNEIISSYCDGKVLRMLGQYEYAEVDDEATGVVNVIRMGTDAVVESYLPDFEGTNC